VRREGSVRVPGDVHDTNPGADERELLRELLAGHARHDHVREEEVDRVRMRRGDLEGGRAVRRRQHRVAAAGEHLAQQRADIGIVLGDEDRLRAADELDRRGRAPLLR
jgi:hypothetical protein